MFNQRNATTWPGILIVIVAAAWTVFHIIWNVAGQTADDYWGVALLILFVLALILSFVQYAQERPTLKTDARTERFPEPAISRFFLGSVGSSALWFVVRMDVGVSGFLPDGRKLTLLSGGRVEKP